MQVTYTYTYTYSLALAPALALTLTLSVRGDRTYDTLVASKTETRKTWLRFDFAYAFKFSSGFQRPLCLVLAHVPISPRGLNLLIRTKTIVALGTRLIKWDLEAFIPKHTLQHVTDIISWFDIEGTWTDLKGYSCNQARSCISGWAFHKTGHWI